jgi:hypothetical protein
LFPPPLPAALFNLGVQVLVLGIGALTSFFWGKFPASSAGSIHERQSRNPGHKREFNHKTAVVTVLAMGILGVDFWHYGSHRILVPGLPWWVLYHAGLTLTLGLAFWWYARTRLQLSAW